MITAIMSGGLINNLLSPQAEAVYNNLRKKPIPFRVTRKSQINHH